MTAIAAQPTLRTPAQIKRARIIGIVLLALAAGAVILFAFPQSWAFPAGLEEGAGDAQFRLVQPTDRFKDFPPLTIPSRGSIYVLSAVLAFLGGIQITRGFGKKTNLVLGLGLLIFIAAFLVWATANSPIGSFSLVSMLKETVIRSFPIAMGALSGVLSERVAVINIGIEGMLLGGAFAAAIVASPVAAQFGAGWGQVAGVTAGLLIGGVLAWILAVLAIKYRVDQIIAGVVINIFVLGLTSFLTVRVLAANPHLNQAPIMRPINIPLLSDIPFFGPILFQHTLLIYVMFALVAFLAFALFRTRWGLRSRAVGEHPKAADTVGVDVFKLRYRNVILGGMIAGLGGAWFILGSVGRFDENMTNGRGFIGLAAMIFGRWHPVGALGAALVFGFADAVQGKLAILQTGIPSEFLLMAPALATIIVVAGLVGKSRPPAADGQPYIKE